MLLTTAQAGVVARLLDELAGVYRGETLGLLAQEASALLGVAVKKCEDMRAVFSDRDSVLEMSGRLAVHRYNRPPVR